MCRQRSAHTFPNYSTFLSTQCLISLFAVTLSLLAVTAVITAPATAGDGGELTVDVVHENGNQASDVNALLIYQDGQLFREVKNSHSVDLTHTFSNLPTGHQYRVDAYINDQFAGSIGPLIIPEDNPLTFWDESKKSKTLTVENPVELSPTIVYEDGETPLDDATVKVKSHEGDTWRSGSTTGDGTVDTSPLDLYPTSSSDAGYYTIEVLHDGREVASKRFDDLDGDTSPTITTDATIPEYDVSVDVDGEGSVDGVPERAVDKGSTVTLTADPNPGYEFDGWNGDSPFGADDQTLTLTIDSDTSVTAEFEELEGDLTVDVQNPNGDSADEVNGLVIWQDSVGSEAFRTFEHYPSVDIPKVIRGLPGGHEYKVNVYVNDQLAGSTDWINIYDSDEHATVTIENRVKLSTTVYYQDGTTPLEDAYVRVTSHQDDSDESGKVVWRSGTTTADGSLDRGSLYLYPTAASDAGYYTVEVNYDGERVASKQIDTLTSSQTVELTTDLTATGDLAVTVNGNTGSALSNAEVILYNTNYEEVDLKVAGENGQVSWTDIATGEYKLEAYAPTGDFLGGKSVTVGTGTKSVTVQHKTPRMTEVAITDKSNGDGIFTVGETVNIAPTVRNDDAELPTRVKIYVDSNGDGSADWEATRGDQTTTVGSGETGLYGAELSLDKTGTYQIRVVTEAYINNEWDPTHHTGWTKQFNVQQGGLNIDIQSIDGQSAGERGYRVGKLIESIAVKVTDDKGNPVPSQSLELQVEDRDFWVSLEHQQNGVYQLETPQKFVAQTEYLNISVRRSDSANTINTSVPVISDLSVLEAPIKGWSPIHSATVRVDNTQYTAVKLNQYNPESREVKYAWLAFYPDGTLIEDSSLRRKVALTAHVDEITQRVSAEDVQFFKEEYPNAVGKVLTYSEIGESLLVTRDTGAELLGTIGGAVLSGGSNVAAKATVKASLKATGKKFAKDVLTNYIQDQIPGTAKTDPLAAFEKGIKWKTRMELEDVQTESKTAGRILGEYTDGETWQYEDASQYWPAYNESLTDGRLYMELRTNMLPSSDARAQLEQITEKTIEGASGVPVDDFVNALDENRLGYISKSFEETAQIRAEHTMKAKSFGKRGQSVQQEALETYGDTVMYAPEDATVKSASISVVSGPSGEYSPGNRVNATVAVTNTGNTAAKFFVGYSVTTTESGGGEVYDNGGSTGDFVHVAAGETVETTVTWVAQKGVPTGQEYGFVAAVWPSVPEAGVQAFDRTRRNDEFSLVGGADLQVEAVETTDKTVTEGEQAILAADISNLGGIQGSRLLNLTVDGELRDQEVVSVAPDSTDAAIFTVTLDEPGQRTVKIGPKSLTIEVTESNQPPQVRFTPSDTDPTIGQTVTFDATETTDSDGQVTAYKWDLDGDGAVEKTTDDPTTSTDFNEATSFDVTLTVVDDDGATAETIRVVTISDESEDPPAVSEFSVSNPSGQELTVQFQSLDNLTDISVPIRSNETVVTTLTTADFTEHGETYTATYTSDHYGTFTATLDEAATNHGNGAASQEDSVRISDSFETEPAITGVTLAAERPDSLSLSVTTNASLASLSVAIENQSGAVVDTFTRSEFTQSSDQYSLQHSGYSAGTYTAQIQSAVTEAGTKLSANKTAQATLASESKPVTPTVTLHPATVTVPRDGTHTYEVVVGDPPGTISAFEYTLSVANASVAQITAATTTQSATLTDITIQDNTSVSVDAALGNLSAAESVALGTVTLTGVTPGDTTVALDVRDVTNASGVPYAYKVGGPTTLTVRAGPAPLVGDRLPTDPDGDGVYEDINGDGRITTGDVQALFANLGDATNAGPAYDINGDGRVTVGDVQALFATV